MWDEAVWLAEYEFMCYEDHLDSGDSTFATIFWILVFVAVPVIMVLLKHG